MNSLNLPNNAGIYGTLAVDAIYFNAQVRKNDEGEYVFAIEETLKDGTKQITALCAGFAYVFVPFASHLNPQLIFLELAANGKAKKQQCETLEILRTELGKLRMYV